MYLVHLFRRTWSYSGMACVVPWLNNNNAPILLSFSFLLQLMIATGDCSTWEYICLYIYMCIYFFPLSFRDWTKIMSIWYTLFLFWLLHWSYQLKGFHRTDLSYIVSLDHWFHLKVKEWYTCKYTLFLRVRLLPNPNISKAIWLPIWLFYFWAKCCRSQTARIMSIQQLLLVSFNNPFTNNAIVV